MSYKLNPFTGKLDLAGGDIQTSGDFKFNTVPSTYSIFRHERGGFTTSGQYGIATAAGGVYKLLINKTDADGNAADTPVPGGDFWMSADGVTFVRGVLENTNLADFGTSWSLPALVDHSVYEGLNIPDTNGSDFYWSLGDPSGTPVALADGDVVQYNAAAGKFKPTQLSSGTTLPTANDGQALIRENGQWVAGPVIGGVDYTISSGTQTTTYTPPTGFSHWNDAFALSTNRGTLSNNDFTSTQTVTGELNSYSTTTKNTGKWYWEIKATAMFNSDGIFGIVQNPGGGFPGGGSSGGIGIKENGTWWLSSAPSGTTTDNVSSTVNGDIMMFALDADASKLWFGRNGTWDNSGDPAAGTGDIARGWSNTIDWHFAVRGYQIGTTYEKKNYLLVNSINTLIPSTTSRSEVSGATASIADGAAADVTIAKTGKAGQLLSIQTSAAAWVTVYTDQAARTADASRTETTDPTPGSGVIAEVITTGAQTVILTPGNTFFNNESTPVSELYLKVVNKSGASAAITTTLKIIPSEV